MGVSFSIGAWDRGCYGVHVDVGCVRPLSKGLEAAHAGSIFVVDDFSLERFFMDACVALFEK